MNFDEAKDYLYNRYKYVFKEMKFPSIYERKELGYDNNYYTVMVFYKDRIVAYEFYTTQVILNRHLENPWII